MKKRRVAIIGAGMAGLTCADRLAASGVTVTVFDKSGDIGGRLASRRRAGATWNHGAPRVSLGGIEVAGSPDMRELLRPLAQRLSIRFSARVARLSRTEAGWSLTIAGSNDYAGERFDAVVCTQPGPQVVQLLGASDLPVPAGLQQVTMAPCWALLLGFPMPAPALEQVPPGPVCARVIRQPRPAHGVDASVREAWVVHADAAWSRQHLELEPPAAAAQMLETLTAAVGRLPAPSQLAAHRWRYARAEAPLGRSHLWLDGPGLGFAGDWCPGGDAEGALHSGRALAEAILRTPST